VPAAGRGAAHDEVQAVVGGEFHGLVGERQLPGERVVQALGAGPVAPDFVPGPALPEGVAAGGQLVATSDNQWQCPGFGTPGRARPRI
jgi:hypothetical protein